jgi:hypothetical protein
MVLRTWILGTLAALLLLGQPGLAWATSVLLLDDVEQAALSTAVVVARVGEAKVSLHPRWSRPVTRTELAVEQVLRGAAPERLVVEQLGGTWQGRRLTIPGDATLIAGVTYVLFLRRTDEGWFLTALQQSAWRIDGDDVVRSLDAELWAKTAEGLRPAPAPPPRRPRAELEAAIRSAK